MKEKYEVVGYDLIAEEYGFSVNDAYHTGISIELSDDCTDKDIVQSLKKAGYLKKTCKDSFFTIDGEPDYSLYVNYESYKGFEPVCELRRIEGENK